MDWLNYHHLLYFWVVASEGSVTAACKRLHLAQPTISADDSATRIKDLGIVFKMHLVMPEVHARTGPNGRSMKTDD